MRGGNLWKGIICVLVAVVLMMPLGFLADDEQSASIYGTKSTGMCGAEDSVCVVQPTPCVGEQDMRIVPACRLQENLAPNPSFEEGSDDTPDDWIHDSEHISYLWDTAHAYDEDKSIGFADIDKDAFPLWRNIDPIPIDPVNNTYVFSLWYKYLAEPYNDNFGGLAVTPLDENGTVCDIIWVLHPPYQGDGWHYFQYTVNSKFNQSMIDEIKYVWLNLCFWPYGAVNPDMEVRFDDIFFGAVEETPQVEISDVSGGIGISATIRNSGDGTAHHVGWSLDIIPLHGAVIRRRGSGSIDELGAGEEIMVDCAKVFGIGTVGLIVRAWGDTEYQKALVLGPIVIML